MADSADLDHIRYFLLPHSQTPQHFSKVHAASVQSGVVKDTKSKEVATTVKEDNLLSTIPFILKKASIEVARAPNALKFSRRR